MSTLLVRLTEVSLCESQIWIDFVKITTEQTTALKFHNIIIKKYVTLKYYGFNNNQ